VAAHYTIRDSGDALRIDVSREVLLWERLLYAGTIAVFVATATAISGLPMIWCSTLTIVGVAIVFASVRQVTARLTATKVEFQTEGLRRRGSDISLLTAKIQRLEFQERPFQQQGIYAVTSWRDHCVLPFVDQVQALEITNAIESKFPGLAEMWRATKTPAV